MSIPLAQASQPEISSSHLNSYPLRFESPASEHSTALLTNEFANELLTAIFLFVRGPPASGALTAARGVCRRWRDVIDAHCRVESSAYPERVWVFREAYRLGYLSPPGLMPQLPADPDDFALYVVEFVRRVIAQHETTLFRELDKFLERFDVDTMDLLLDVENRVAAGAWEGLTAEQISAAAEYIHPSDLKNAQDLDIIPYYSWEEHNFRTKIFANGCSRAEHFADWTDEEIFDAAYENTRTGDRSIARAAVWMARKGILGADDVEEWLLTIFPSIIIENVSPLPWQLTTAMEFLDAIEERALKPVLTYRALLTSVWAGECWPLLQRLVQMCPEQLRRTIWCPLDVSDLDRRGNYIGSRVGREFIARLRLLLTGKGAMPDLVEVFRWLYMQDMYLRDDISSEDAERLIAGVKEDQFLYYPRNLPVSERPHDTLVAAHTETIIKWLSRLL